MGLWESGIWDTFVRELVKAAKGVDLIIVAIRHGGIDEACGHMALRLPCARAVLRTTAATTGWTGGHDERLL